MVNDMRLGDLDALKAEFTGNFGRELWHYTGIWATIDVAPTIDAVPVVHGHWIKGVIEREPVIKNGKVYRNDTLTFQCSKCKETFAGITNGFNFCPYCGAKMDGDQK
jgi:ribosomal protein L37AE/L43A